MHVEMPVVLQVRCPTLGYNCKEKEKKIMANFSTVRARTHTHKYTCIHI